MEKAFINILNGYLTEDVSENQEVKLKDMGLDSMKSIELLITLEENYGISFPDELLNSSTFKNAKSLWITVQKIKNGEI